MSNRITFDQISNPDFSGVNNLLISGGQQYQNAVKGLADTLKGVQTEVRSNNNAQIQNYLNQATTADQLQNPEFRQGYQNLLNSLKYEYDTEAAAKNYDARMDTLNQRKNDALTLQRNQLGLDSGTWHFAQDKKNQANNEITQEYLSTNDPLLQAVIKEKAQANGLTINPATVQDYQAKDLGLQQAQQSIAFAAEEQPYKLKNLKANLTNIETQTEGQRLKNQAQQSENKLTSTINNASYNAFLAQNPLANATPKQVQEIQSLGRTMQAGLNKTWGGSQTTYGQFMDTEGTKLGLTPDELMLAKAMFTRESNWDSAVKSPQNAGGIAQLIPATAKRFGVTDRSNPYQSMLGGMKYIKYLSNRYGGDTRKIAAAYNTGEGNLDKYGLDTVLSENWNVRKNAGETGRYVDTVHRLSSAYNAGNGGSSVVMPAGVSGRASAQNTNQLQKAYENSPQGIIQSFVKADGDLKTKSFTAPSKDFGAGTYKNPTEWASSMKKGMSTNAMITNMLDVTRKTNFKFSDKNSENSFNKNGVEDWGKLTDVQKAGVLERAYNNVVNQNNNWLGERTWNIGDKDLVQFQKAIQAETDTLLSGNKKRFEDSLDANRMNTLTRLVNQHGFTPQQAAQAMNLDAATVQRLFGVAQPNASEVIKNAATAITNKTPLKWSGGGGVLGIGGTIPFPNKNH